MKTKKQLIDETKEMVFTHNRSSIDISLWNYDSERISTISTRDTDAFLKYFDYGQGISDDKTAIQNFLDELL